MKTKLLLYCTKNKWRLFFDKVKQIFTLGKVKSNNDLNGKIVAECDFEVEDIEFEYTFHKGYSDVSFRTKQLQENELFNKSCLRYFEMTNYFNRRWIMEEKGKCGYAIHIKNLHIFDEPRELNHYMVYDKSYDNMFGWEFDEEDKYNPLTKAPQNMMRVWLYENGEWVMYILISIRPEHLVNILNGNKTIEIRKKILNEMKEQI